MKLRPPPLDAGLLVSAFVVFTLGSFSLLASDPMWFWDREALHNAGVAREILAGHGKYLFALQYMEFCGGCSVEALLGAAAFAALGETFVAWKLVPIAFGLLLIAGGWMLLEGPKGSTASRAWLLITCLPPVLVAQSMVMAWGNHYEVFALVVWAAVLADRIVERPLLLRRWAGLAALLGFIAWFSLTGVVVIPLVALRLAGAARTVWRGRGARSLAAVSAGLVAGLTPLVLFVALDDRNPFEFALQFQSSEGRWEYLGERAAQLSLAAYGWVFQAPGTGTTNISSWASVFGLWGLVLAGVSLARRRPWPSLMLLGYGVVYLISPAEPSGLGQSSLPPPVDQRYLLPWLFSLLLAGSAGIERLWGSPRAGRATAGALALMLFVPGLLARAEWLESRSARTAPLNAPQPYDYPVLAGVGFWRLPPDALTTDWTTTDRISQVNAARAIGLRLTYRFVETDPDLLHAFVTEVRNLPVPSAWVFAGIGREVRSALVDLGDFRADQRGFIERLLRLGELLSPEESEAFFEMIWPNNRILGRVLMEELPDGCPLCPSRGASLVELPDELDVIDSSLLPQEALEATGARRRDLLLGASSALGYDLGHRPENVEALVASLDAADALLVRDGFERGAAGRWRRIYTDATPVFLLP